MKHIKKFKILLRISILKKHLCYLNNPIIIMIIKVKIFHNKMDLEHQVLQKLIIITFITKVKHLNYNIKIVIVAVVVVEIA